MRKLRNILLVLCGFITTLTFGIASSLAPAGAAPSAVNSVFLETFTATNSTTQQMSGVTASLGVGGTIVISAPSGAGEFELGIKPPGQQALAAGQEYDTTDGTVFSIQNPGGALPGACGTDSNDGSSVFVDQASYDEQGNPTILGIEFDIVCDATHIEYFGTAAVNLEPTTVGQGYYIYEQDGALNGFGNDSYLNYLGDLSTVNLNQPIVGMATTTDGGGYWMVATDGGIFAFGDAQFWGSTGSLRLNQPIVGMAATPDGNGYWLVAADGGIFAFGDAQFYGSTGAIRLNKPIVGMTPTSDGKGYWLVASDGGIFAFGDAQFHGSTGAIRLNQPIVGMAATPTGNGYWMVASDGGIFAFGDAQFFGSTGAIHLNQPIVGMTPTPDGRGYWFTASDGGVFAFGDAPFAGSLGGLGVDDAAGITH